MEVEEVKEVEELQLRMRSGLEFCEEILQLKGNGHEL